jgi:hypothetical protein
LDLPDHVRRGVEALKADRPAEAAEALRPVAEDAELAAAEDLRDVRLRVLTLYAQALLGSDRAAEAEATLRDAAALADVLEDAEGRKVVKGLRAQAATAAMEAHRKAAEAKAAAKLSAVPMADLVARNPDARARADALIRKAQADLDVGDAASGAACAREVLENAPTAREEVLARLLLARAEPGSASQQLEAALTRATTAGEFNLVGAVAKTAELAGVPVPALPLAGRPVR